MSIEATLYLIDVFGNLRNALLPFLVLSSMISLALLGFLFFDCDKEDRPSWAISACKYLVIGSVVSILLSILIPSGKTMHMMLAANIIKAPEVPNKILLKTIEMRLEEYVDEVKKKVNN